MSQPDKPQIVSYDGGYHNQDLELSRGRILSNGSWKKQRVIVLIPSANLIAAKVALSHWNIIFPPNQPVHRMLILGTEVGEAYSMALEQILAHPDLSQWEYILTLEHDNLVPPDIVLKLLESMEKHPEFYCIAGLYWTKGHGGMPMIYGDVNDSVVNFRPQPPKLNTVQEAYGLGMGANLWRLQAFKDPRLERPFFKTRASAAGVGTQDLAHFADARKYGYRAACDTRVLVGHYDYDGSIGGIPDFTW